jgi:hydrogenase-4 component B
VNAAYATGMALLAAAALLPWLEERLALAAAATGSIVLGAVGFASAAGWAHATVRLGSWLGFGPAALVSDGLSGIFYAVVGATGAAVSLALLERPPARAPAALHSLLLLAVCAAIGADQAFLFLLAWETITLSLYLLAAADPDRPGSLRAASFGGALAKAGGACVLAAFALFYGETGSFSFAAWAHAAPHLGGPASVAFVLLLAGLGSKIGLLPFQAGLPPLYGAAPAATPATISVAFAAGCYGLWRLVFATLGPGPVWWGELVIVLGGLTALTGILYAVTQDDIARLLGFSSVEQGGIVLLGFGVALLGQAEHRPQLAAVGLLAATLQVIMHAVAKALALIGADRVTRATGRRDLRPLGGLARELPRTAAGFGLAVLTLAALPPFGGFVSEWFTFEALLQGFRVDSTIAQLLMALGAAMLALTTGIGLLAFAKLYGGIFLGRSRTQLGGAREPAGPALGLAGLALVALLLGAAAPWEIRWLGRALRETLGFDLAGTAIRFPLVLGPVYRNFSVLAPTWLALGLVAFAATAALAVRLVLRPHVRRAPVWLSGTAVDLDAVQYTPDGYVNPIRVVLASAYGYRRELEPPAAGTHARTLRTRIVPAFEERFYRPLARSGLRLSAQARRLQSGRLGAYLLYILLVFVAALALIPALSR